MDVQVLLYQPDLIYYVTTHMYSYRAKPSCCEPVIQSYTTSVQHRLNQLVPICNRILKAISFYL